MIAERAWAEAIGELERVRAPRRAARFDDAMLLRATDRTSIDDLWAGLLERAPFRRPFDAAAHERVAPGDSERVLTAARAAADRRVDLLGSGPVTLPTPIDWHRDFRTGHVWKPRFWRSIVYANPDSPSDVKVPWELSRMQWLIPCGQAYLLTGDEHHAQVARGVVEEWIAANPYGASVNWVVTMEVALRIFTWTWLLGALGASEAWSDAAFRSSFLRALYLHGDFTSRNLERSDVNGNHYTADAAGLTIAGTLFDRPEWRDSGWRILCDELPLQVHPDGVDFEASTAYHRLVAELFLLPALYREQVGLPVPAAYRERVVAMGRFAAAYTRLDGSAPGWGDSDDARALPLGGAAPSDHRHLLGAIGAAWGADDVLARFSGPRSEISWLLGASTAAGLPEQAASPSPAAFRDGGVYILAAGSDHVFIDCGPVGLANRGGHGHNDCLSFDAMLDGVHIAVDPGSFVYTASWEWRNRFRSTAAHNTPLVDDSEQATLDTGLLWTLGAEAVPEVRDFDATAFRFVGAHYGYMRLPDGVLVVRTIELDTAHHRLLIADQFQGKGQHVVAVPLQLPAGAMVEPTGDASVGVTVAHRRFVIRWRSPADWRLTTESSWVSPSYGIKKPAPRLLWERDGKLARLEVEVARAR